MEQKSDVLPPWPSEPRQYQWKGTISADKSIWNMLSHCLPRKEDVFLKVKHCDGQSDSEIDGFLSRTTTLMKLQNAHLMTPVHCFVHKSYIWVIYPRHSGGPLIEALGSHYPNGIPSEPMVAAILYDAAQGLVNLHQQQQCHRSISAQALHVDVGTGTTLLSNFGELKEIKWKHKQGRRDTMIAPQRHPFTDPLILLGDDRANWYAGDVYSLGITALQLCYGSTPPLTAKHTMQGTPISTDLYDTKCPFSSSFKQLVKDCCAQVDSRVTAKQLVQHKFFKQRADADAVKAFFGHILKSTEQRINGALQRPMWFPVRADEADALGDENVNASNHVLTVTPAQNQSETASEQAIDETDEKVRPELADEAWSFSTTIHSKSDLEAAAKAQLAQNANQSPEVHQPEIVEKEKASPPAQRGRERAQVNGSARKYRISFSESQSDARALVSSVDTPATGGGAGPNSVPPVQVGRFGVSYPSRMSHSESRPVEPSETREDSAYEPESGSQSSQHVQEQDHLDEPDAKGGNGQTRQIRRFIISNAEVSADEVDEAVDTPQPQDAVQPQQQQQAQEAQGQGQGQPSPEQQAQVQEAQAQGQGQGQAQGGGGAESEWVQPAKDKLQWTAKECSEWVSSLGGKYKQYEDSFIENGIDGEFLKELDSETLAEIVKSVLHRKKILTAWQKL